MVQSTNRLKQNLKAEVGKVIDDKLAPIFQEKFNGNGVQDNMYARFSLPHKQSMRIDIDPQQKQLEIHCQHIHLHVDLTNDFSAQSTRFKKDEQGMIGVNGAQAKDFSDMEYF